MTAQIYEPDLRVLPSPEAVTEAAAEEIVAFVNGTRDPVLGLATGRTPLAVYARLREAHASGRVSFARVTTFNLDEYLGLAPDHPASYHAYMRRELFDHVDAPPGQCHLPDGTDNPEAAAACYEVLIREAGGIGLQLLGTGGNGHIGFNEPGATFDSRTRQVTLADATRNANASEFPAGETPPCKAITMGIATILEARKLLLLAVGAHKAAALAAAFRNPLDTHVPAAAVRTHPSTTILCDRKAARIG